MKDFRDSVVLRSAILMGLDENDNKILKEIPNFIKCIAAKKLPNTQFLCFLYLFRCNSESETQNIIFDNYDKSLEKFTIKRNANRAAEKLRELITKNIEIKKWIREWKEALKIT